MAFARYPIKPNMRHHRINLHPSIRAFGAGVKREIWPTLLTVTGATICGFSYSLFQVPHNIAAGGLGGIAIVIHHYVKWPIGLMILLMNVPLVVLGFFYLGRWRFLGRTAIGIVTFSTATELSLAYLPAYFEQFPVTNDLLLSAIYSGLIGGIGGGLVYAGGATLGGTGITGRIIQLKKGMPLSQIYLYTDGVIVGMAGVVFGWELALYAMLTLLIGGAASDYVLEGPSRTRTAIIVTDKPQEVSHALQEGLKHGITSWDVTGGHSAQPHTVIMCTFYRPQANEFKRIISQVDPSAFVSIQVTQQTLGSGFTRLYDT